MKTNPVLEAFRKESNLSWRRFSELYTDIAGVVSAPSSNMLFNGIDKREYNGEIRELIDHVVYTGHFAPGTGAKWIIGKYKNQWDFKEFLEYITRLTAYIISQGKDQISTRDTRPELHCNKVGKWLFNDKGDDGDQVGAPVVNSIADSEDSTVRLESQSHGSTTIADTVIDQSHGSTTIADTVIDQGEMRDQESDCDSEDTVRAAS